MATKQIHNYTAAVAIDASADYLLIDPASSGIYKSINRNTLLGLSSAPLGLTDSQSPTNKVFNNTNTLTVKAANLTVQDGADTTKQANFVASSITTGTTRSYTLPDASGTVVLTGATQTLTAKTLTSPTMTGGTIDNTTITVDSISGHTVATTVTVGNVQMANGVVNTSGAVTSTAIAVGAVQPQALVTGTGTGWAWSSWTPTWTNVSGGATTYAKYIQIGKTVHFRIKYTLGGAGVSGEVTFSPPVNVNAGYVSGDMVDGIGKFTNTGVQDYTAVMEVSSATAIILRPIHADGSRATNGNAASSTDPFTFGNTNYFQAVGSYEAV